MEPLRVEATVDEHGNLILRNLEPGQRVVVILVPAEPGLANGYSSLRGLPVELRDPFEPASVWR